MSLSLPLESCPHSTARKNLLAREMRGMFVMEEVLAELLFGEIWCLKHTNARCGVFFCLLQKLRDDGGRRRGAECPNPCKPGAEILLEP